jgi:type III secretion protein C
VWLVGTFVLGGRLATRAIAVVLTGVSLFASPLPSDASTIPWRQSRVQLKAADLPIGAALERIAAGAGVRVALDSRVTGTLNLDLDAEPAGLLRQLEGLFGFMSYFDGSTLHISSIERNATVMLRLQGTSPAAFDATLQRLGIADPRFPIRHDQATGLAVVSGPPRFIELVRGVAKGARVASDPEGEEIRVFPLRYASARDRQMTSGTETLTLPGVASLMRTVHHGSDAGGGPGSGAAARRPAVSNAPKPTRRDVPGGSIDVPPASHEAFEDLLSRYSMLPPPGQSGNLLPQIHADPRQNAVIVRDRSDRMESHQQLLRLLDVKPRLIELHVRIMEAETAFVPIPDVTPPLSGDPVSPASPVSPDPTYTDGTAHRRTPTVRIRAPLPETPLATSGRASIIAEPRLMVLDNTVAEFSNLRTLTAPGSAPAPETVRLETGLRLRILPQSMVDADGSRRIQLSVTLHDGLVAMRNGESEDANTSHSISTTAIVRPGESMMVGGLSLDYSRGPTGKSPPRSDGWAGTNRGRSERMYLITPRFVDEGSP